MHSAEGEVQTVFIAGVRVSAMVMKAAPQPPDYCTHCLCTSLLMCSY